MSGVVYFEFVYSISKKMITLSQEILEQISSCLPFPARVTFAHTCRSIRRASDRTLWDTINITKASSPQRRPFWPNVPYHDLIHTEFKRILPYVREVIFEEPIDDFHLPDVLKLLEGTKGLRRILGMEIEQTFDSPLISNHTLATRFLSLTNLQHLELSGTVWESYNDMTPPSSPSWPHLTSVNVLSSGNLPPLAQFAPNVEHIRIFHGEESVSEKYRVIQADRLQGLNKLAIISCFQVGHPQLQELSKCKQLREMRIFGFNDIGFSNLTLKFMNLQSLSIDEDDIRVPRFSPKIVAPTLRTLNISIQYEHVQKLLRSCQDTLISLDLYNAYDNWIPVGTFPRVTRLRLTSSFCIDHTTWCRSCEKLMKRIHKLFPNLQRLEINHMAATFEWIHFGYFEHLEHVRYCGAIDARSLSSFGLPNIKMVDNSFVLEK